MKNNQETFQSVHPLTVIIEIIHTIIIQFIPFVITVVVFIQFNYPIVKKVCFIVILYLLWKLLSSIVSDYLHFKNLTYNLNIDSIQINKQGWYRSKCLIPYNRVQHVERDQTFISRMFSLHQVTIHTAGDVHVICAVTETEADRISSAIFEKIRELPKDGEQTQ
ncbi:PH domain-containing protein [Bacillus sp. AFS017336]|uniref:PH domain-containing protein n=1 Tax=Bacillus sp. AFS017336 TaxID=2033489 RepID=UPI0015CF73B2|nr:PH domain-containing protein [Bacillus sp. AFS017336]